MTMRAKLAELFYRLFRRRRTKPVERRRDPYRAPRILTPFDP